MKKYQKKTWFYWKKLVEDFLCPTVIGPARSDLSGQSPYLILGMQALSYIRIGTAPDVMESDRYATSNQFLLATQYALAPCFKISQT